MNWVQGKPVAVVKVGGDIVQHTESSSALADNISDLLKSGWHCVILHGGGPQVSKLQAVHGLPVNKVGGRRITSKDDLRVVKQALCGEVNVDLVATLVAHGINAFGCHGASSGLIQATRRPPQAVTGSDGELIDFGEVGDVSFINRDLIRGLIELQQVPVIASLGISENGAVFNINADTTAVRIAHALRAGALILTTGVGGIYRDINDAASRIDTISPSQARRLVEQGIISDGMIPKVEESLKLVEAGVACVGITDASVRHSLVDLINQKPGCGTRFVIE